jgi:predicted DsbA family dithiol-disulfide isomerase
MQEPSVRISVWSDYVCPFCYLELPVLDALAGEMGERLAIDWRAFELRPAPAPTLDPDGDYLHRVWNASVYPMAAARGLVLRLPPVQPRSRLALEAASFAREAGRFDTMNRGLFRAFFEEGRDIGELPVLLDIAGAAGLDRDALAQALASGARRAEVAADRVHAERLGITGVPALRIVGRGGAVLLGGAQPIEALRAAIDRVHGDARSEENPHRTD